MKTRSCGLALSAAFLFLAAGRLEAGAFHDHVVFTLWGRGRWEAVDYFKPGAGIARTASRYGFLGTQVRAGARATFPHFQFVLELQDTRLFGLPTDASLPPPAGNLGPGALYYAHTPRSTQSSTFLKQAHLTYRHSGLSATVGRFEISDGLDSVPADATLAWLRRSRVSERLVGPFGYTHVSRSFDALRLSYDEAGWNATAFVGRPTQGGYEIEAQDALEGVRLAGLAATAKRLRAGRSELRLFYLHYLDSRASPLKSDNRPAALRRADVAAIRVHTFGGHVAAIADAGPGTADLLAWTAFQEGRWGALDHSAWAFAAEAGYQVTRLRGSPWIRFGLNRGSGDADPRDDRHGTFFQLIPTPRIYAQFPFFNMMNDRDVFVQLILKPAIRVTLRADYHRLRLGEEADLWYSGGGATSARVFGFSGLPSGGHRSLAQLADLGVTLRINPRVSAYAYGAHAFGGPVVAQTFAGGQGASYGYLELIFRY